MAKAPKVTCRVCNREVAGRASPDTVHGDGKYPVPHKDPRTDEPCPGADVFAFGEMPI